MKFRLFIYLPFILFGSCSTSGQQYDSAYGKPLIVLIETDPWLMVIGSDVPSFVLYEKGQVIYKSVENDTLKIYEVTLSQQELEKTIQSFSITEDIYKLPNNIEASGWTDQPSTILRLNLAHKKNISVYGSLRSNSEARGKTPQTFLSVYDKIKKFKGSYPKEWLPQKFEVIFWDFSYAKQKRPWIAGFPDLESSSTIKMGNDSYSVFIEKSKYGEFKKYYDSLSDTEAVEINGRKMAVSFRLPFPNIK